MNIARYLTTPDAERRTMLDQGLERMNLRQASLEKDVFVCYFLHQAFVCAGVGELSHLKEARRFQRPCYYGSLLRGCGPCR